MIPPILSTLCMLSRAKREQEVAMLKKLIEDEGRSHEAQVHELKQKHAQAVDELSQQLDQSKRVRKLLNTGKKKVQNV